MSVYGKAGGGGEGGGSGRGARGKQWLGTGILKQIWPRPRRNAVSDDTLRKAQEIARKAERDGLPQAGAVAARLNVHERTAERYLQQARERGLG